MEEQTGFKTEEGVCQGFVLSPYLFNLYAEYIMRDTRLDESHTGIKISEKKYQQSQIISL